MVKLACDFDFQFGMSRHCVIVNRDTAISGDELTILGQNQRIYFK
jgi:hypothetical protein